MLMFCSIGAVFGVGSVLDTVFSQVCAQCLPVRLEEGVVQRGPVCVWMCIYVSIWK
jgi:hypothetical protein